MKKEKLIEYCRRNGAKETMAVVRRMRGGITGLEGQIILAMADLETRCSRREKTLFQRSGGR